MESCSIHAVPVAPEARFNPTTYTVTEGEVVELIVELVGQSLEPIEVEVFLVNDTASGKPDHNTNQVRM